jgi:hypothetical protein
LNHLRGEQAALEARAVWRAPSDKAPVEKSSAPTRLDAAARSRRTEETKRRFEQLWEDPAFVRLMVLRMHLPLDRQYGSLFQALKLSPPELERLKNALIEKQLAVADARRLARDHLSGSDQSRFVATVSTDSDKPIEVVLSRQGFQQYQIYESTWPLRRRILDVAERLEHLGQPLGAPQIDELLEALKQEVPPEKGGGSYSAIACFPSGFLEQAKPVLTGVQFETLLRMNEELQAIDALTQMQKPGPPAALSPVSAPLEPESPSHYTSR